MAYRIAQLKITSRDDMHTVSENGYIYALNQNQPYFNNYLPLEYSYACFDIGLSLCLCLSVRFSRGC